MAQSITQVCANCNTPVPAHVSFCPNCGTPAHAGNGHAASSAPTQKAPPPLYASYPPQTPPVSQPVPPGQQGYQASFHSSQPPPTYARPQKNSSGGALKVGVILLLLVLLLGAGGFLTLRFVTGRSGNTTNTGAKSEIPPTRAPLTTTPINATVTYASVDITILNAQQAASFADDRETPAQGVVRLNLHAVQNGADDTNSGSSIDPYYHYSTAFALILPGGRKVPPAGYKEVNGPTKKGNQTTWIDFPVPTTVKVNQLVLQMGTDTEAQIALPLTGQANLSQYQAKQVSPNVRVPYGGTFWTLTTGTAKLSDGGVQADKGQRFLVLALTIDNPSSQGTNGYPPDYLRLQFGGTTISETSDTIPTTVAGTSHLIGLVAFLVPQEETSFTLVLLPSDLNGATSQATIPFQIP